MEFIEKMVSDRTLNEAFTHVCRSRKKYYASIDHDVLFKILEYYIGETPLLFLLYR